MRTVRGGHLVRTAVAAAVVLIAAAGCSPGTARPQAEGAGAGGVLGGLEQRSASGAAPLTTDAARGGHEVVAAGAAQAPYNYAPTAMLDGEQTRMWWCSQYGDAAPAGDDIVYGQAPTISGPFMGPEGRLPEAVLSGNPGQFDGVHTCDPSVIKVDGIYYVYYTGAAGDHALGNSIGLATSVDGVHWARANDGEPIVNPADDVHRRNTYGVGQPAAVHLDGWFYLMFTDTTGRGSGHNGAGQFILRSQDPGFGGGVQTLGRDGFAPVAHTSSARARSLVDAFSADLMWVEALNAFAIAHQTPQGTAMTFWNRDFTGNPYPPVSVPGPWREGPGLLRQPDGHAPISQRDPCGRVPLDVVRATAGGGPAQAPTNLRHFGVDIRDLTACADKHRAMTVLDGFAMPSPVRTMDLVTHGSVVRIDRRSVAEALAGRVLDRRIPALDAYPVAARLSAGARALSAPGMGSGVVLDDGQLWPIQSAAVTELNGSPVQSVTQQEWKRYPVGSPLGR